MAYSFSTSVGDAVTTVFAFTFTGLDKGYLNKSDVHVELVDEQGVWAEVQFNTGWVFETTNSIRFLQTPPPVNTKFPHNIRIRRIMDKSSPYADWSVGQNFDEQTLDNSFLKLLYIEHELLDGFGMRDATGNINMHGYRITDMADAVDDNDAVNLNQVRLMLANAGANAVIPLQSPRYIGDGITTVFNTTASTKLQESSFFVQLDGVKQRPVTDYLVTSIGQISFVDAPEVGTKIDILLFNPSILEDPSSLPVISSGSTTSRTLGERFNTYKNVLDYGAVSGGVIDCTDSFNLAQSEGTVLVPEGTFKISGNVNLLNSMYGVDKKNCELVFDNTDGFTILSNDITLDNLTIKQVNGIGRFVLTQTPYTGITISNCIWDGFQVGRRFNVSGTETSGIGEFSVIKHNTVKNVKNIDPEDGDGISVTASNIEVLDNKVWDNESEGIKVAGNGKEYTNVIGNDCRRNGRDGIDMFNGGRKCLVTHNTLVDNTSQGIEIKNSELPVPDPTDNSEILVSDNIVTGGVTGINVVANNCSVHDNIIDSTIGVRAGGLGTNVTNNTITATQRCLDIRGMQGAVLKDNNCKLTSTGFLIRLAQNQSVDNPANYIDCKDIVIKDNNLNGGNFTDYGVTLTSGGTTLQSIDIGRNSVDNVVKGLVSPSTSTTITAILNTSALVTNIYQNGSGTLVVFNDVQTAAIGNGFEILLHGEFIDVGASSRLLRLRLGNSIFEEVNLQTSEIPNGNFNIRMSCYRSSNNSYILSYEGVAGGTNNISGVATGSLTGVFDTTSIKVLLDVAGSSVNPSASIQLAKLNGIR